MTAVAVVLMDRAGRRALLLVSLCGLGVCACGMGLFHRNGQQPAWLALGSLGGYIVSFSLGLGAIPWLLMGEIFPVHTILYYTILHYTTLYYTILYTRTDKSCMVHRPQVLARACHVYMCLHTYTYVYQAHARASAASAATLLNWSFSFVMTLCFDGLNRGLGPANVFFLFAAICAAGAAFVARCVPETKGKSLDEVQALFTRH